MTAVEQRAARPVEIVPGLLRVRVPLPFPPSEVNAWLLSDVGGWTLIDSGVDDAPTRALFSDVLADPILKGEGITRLLVTHFHPDHIGLAGWLHARTGAPIQMSRIEWLQARLILSEPQEVPLAAFLTQYRRCGAPTDFLTQLERRGLFYRRWVGPLPYDHRTIREGDALDLAGTMWRVITGEGHAPEMVCLFSAERRILIAADQILGRITPHIGLHPADPTADPLGAYLACLSKFEGLPQDTLVLPSHGDPFQGLDARIAGLRAHHEERLRRLIDFCDVPRTVMETTSVLFRALAPEQIGFGLGEALAHLRHLVVRGAMEDVGDPELSRFVRR
ncbi:MBL fold metallo-hydrolase [Aquabacter spiritensis]|uniref:Glyoxylase-like metal-dependent hydrolase (Beta-lactamase superfamily II) n=1 Tax=Aquabacter spiritensis TaxID=933073 RepID=A0A4V2UXA2_9HYPH|nr:MBL fold metallo-hydrolase [Aquabacter spiritensis]TCT02688.1 glyoxylase-like metal-dependent hydrolase (beta-lactamase superfamily II) [Aquabacter spiritensis]